MSGFIRVAQLALDVRKANVDGLVRLIHLEILYIDDEGRWEIENKGKVNSRWIFPTIYVIST